MKETTIKTSRRSIPHLIDLPIKSIGEVRQSLDGAEISLKIDGAGIRFGKDELGQFFFETSRSGIIRSGQQFIDHANSRPSANQERAYHYKNLFNDIKDSCIWKELPNDSKVVCEVLYNPMAIIQNNKACFVSVKYDTSKLGTTMTLSPINVMIGSSGKDHKETDGILSNLFMISNKQIKIVDPNIDVEIPKELKHGPENDEDFKILLDVFFRQKLKEINILGSENEGLVIRAGTKIFKVSAKR